MKVEFSIYQQKDSDIAQVWDLSDVAKQLNVVKAALMNVGNGNFVVLTKADGSSTTLPCSKEMKPEHMSEARVALMKKPNADGTPAYVVIRPEGESTVVLKTIRF